MDFVGCSPVGLLVQRLSVPSCEVNGQGSSPVWAILFFLLHSTLKLIIVFKSFYGYGLAGLGFGIRVSVALYRVSFYVYSLDNESHLGKKFARRASLNSGKIKERRSKGQGPGPTKARVYIEQCSDIL